MQATVHSNTRSTRVSWETGGHVEVLLRSYCYRRRAGRRGGASPRSAPPPASKALSHTSPLRLLWPPRWLPSGSHRSHQLRKLREAQLRRAAIADGQKQPHTLLTANDRTIRMGAVRHGATLHRLCAAAVPCTCIRAFGRSRMYRRVHAYAVLWRWWVGAARVMGRTFASAREIPNNSLTATICGTNSCA